MYGNSLNDSDGCILVGEAIDTNYHLINSRLALNKLMKLLEGKQWQVSIIGE
jgi:hypothetical protein